MRRSIAFDAAAGYYDRTRALPVAVQARQTALLLGELQDRGHCLEVGVGTGRVALPLREGGVPIFGIDLSRPMLLRLQENAGGGPARVARADATRLPFADHSFGAALACHVLHLIPEWRRAVREMVRVTRAGGLVLIDRGGGPAAWQELQRHFFSETGDRSWPVGLGRVDDLDAELAGLGARLRILEPIERRERGSVGDRIDSLEQGIYAGCWTLSAQTLQRAASATRRWAIERYGSLAAEVEVTHTIRWRAYDLT